MNVIIKMLDLKVVMDNTTTDKTKIIEKFNYSHNVSPNMLTTHKIYA